MKRQSTIAVTPEIANKEEEEGNMNNRQPLYYIEEAEYVLEKALSLLTEYIRDYRNKEALVDWQYVHGGIIACIDLAHDYFYEFSISSETDAQPFEQSKEENVE